MQDDRSMSVALEAVERDAWLDMFAAAPAAAAGPLQLASKRIGEIGLLASVAVPITELNRAMGVRVDAGTTTAELDEALDWLNANAAKGWAFQVGPFPESEALTDWLRSHELAPSGNGWAKQRLTKLDGIADFAAEGIEVRRADAASAEIFGRTTQAGFGLPEATAEWFAALVGRRGWRTYLAYRDGVAVAAGSMFVRGDWAWLGAAATLAQHRRHGAHTALLSQRIAEGRAEGLSGLTIETGYPSPGDRTSFPSFENCRRVGFELVYRRPNYKRV